MRDDVFFKKINDDLVSIIKYNDDDFIYKLDNVVAKIFLMLVEGIEISDIKTRLLTDNIQVSDEVIDQIINDLIELSVIAKD